MIRWRAAACAALLAALAMAAWAQTNAPVAVAPTAGVAPAAAPSANVISQTAPSPVATNTVSIIEMLQTDSAFQSYTNLLEHSLFVPASEIGGSSASDTGPAFAGSLRLTGFFVRGSVIEASLEDRNEPDKKMFIKAGDVIADTEIKVVGFDLRGRAVLLKKGDEEGRLEYDNEVMPAPTTAGKPGVPGMPAVPPPQGTMMPRPGMPPTLQPPGTFSSARTSTASSRTTTTSPTAASGGSGSSNQQMSRREQRQQQIARLQQVMQSTTDPAAKQRLQSYIQMLEKANAQE